MTVRRTDWNTSGLSGPYNVSCRSCWLKVSAMTFVPAVSAAMVSRHCRTHLENAAGGSCGMITKPANQPTKSLSVPLVMGRAPTRKSTSILLGPSISPESGRPEECDCTNRFREVNY